MRDAYVGDARGVSLGRGAEPSKNARVTPKISNMVVLTKGPGTGGWNGRVGNPVFVETALGTVVRSRPSFTSPPSGKQLIARARMARVSAAYGKLTAAQLANWGNFGRTLNLSGQQAFSRLANKLLQLNPTATLPTDPPASPFFGDGITLVSAATAGVGITFSTAGNNRVGVTTELLTQRLASTARRTYLTHYRTQAFFTFASGASSRLVNLSPGVYATAVRFVETATGRMTEVFELGLRIV